MTLYASFVGVDLP